MTTPRLREGHPHTGGRAAAGRRTALAAACGLAWASLAGCASAAAHDPARPSADGPTGVGGVCETVMGLHPGEAHYDGCVASLSASQESLERGRALERARAGCLGQGLAADGPALAECALRPGEAAAPAAGPARAAVARTVAAGSYFYASPREVFRREQSSCARLGLDPADGAFAGCVAGLASALFAADHPAN
jgi:hypothetical protein